MDPLLAGLSEEAARVVDPAYEVNPACNYFFMAASTFFIAAAGTWVTERIVVPRLGEYRGDEKPEEIQTLSAAEKRGLWLALAAGLVFTGLLLWGTVPSGGFLRDPVTDGVLRSPFMSGIVALIFIAGTFMGLAFGVGAGTLRSDEDVIKAMGKAMSTLGVAWVELDGRRAQDAVIPLGRDPVKHRVHVRMGPPASLPPY